MALQNKWVALKHLKMYFFYSHMTGKDIAKIAHPLSYIEVITTMKTLILFKGNAILHDGSTESYCFDTSHFCSFLSFLFFL